MPKAKRKRREPKPPVYPPHPDIAVLNAQQEEFAEAARVSMEKAEEVKDAIRVAVFELLSASPPEDATVPDDAECLVLGYHPCPNGSPTGECIYNNEEDPSLDSCLYCGQPEERK